MKNQYYVYILTNFTNTVLYVGVTNDIVRRVYEHKEKLIAGFTQKYKVDKLVYYEVYQDPETAIKREKTIKNLLRKKKIVLVESLNPTFQDLYQCFYKILSLRFRMTKTQIPYSN